MKNDLTREEWIALARALNICKVDTSQLSSHDIKVFNKAKKKIIKSAYWMIEKVYGSIVGKSILNDPVEPNQSLKEQLISKKKDSHHIWFERWYEKENLEKVLFQSASEGFSGYNLNFSDDDYLNRRLRDSRTVELLKEKLPSINISYKKSEWKNIINQTRHTEKIIFDWSESNG
ncbi:hypothetical protein [Enterococcus sp. 2201sp1_2201st1_B8_2201SCRN_220225]|uniref:hypothetical protein n=1 Tax=unclassified Enterococcus TaxID=2608891 RepID=UPI0034A4D228